MKPNVYFTKKTKPNIWWFLFLLVYLAFGVLTIGGCSALKSQELRTIAQTSDDEFSPLAGMIHFYQGPMNHLNSVRMGECPMEPSCSNYALQAIHKHGFLLGWFMACDRLMRCGRDEIDISPEIIAYGKYKCLDPLVSNDEWLDCRHFQNQNSD